RSVGFIVAYFSFFFNTTATTRLFTLSLHDALPIFELLIETIIIVAKLHQLLRGELEHIRNILGAARVINERGVPIDDDEIVLVVDRKSTRLNSSHVAISYAVFCLKKKKLHEHNAAR